MSFYPDLKGTSSENHLLFDLGFSYALLSRAQQILRQVRDTDDVPKEDDVLSEVIQEMIEDIDGFHQGRLHLIDDIYDSAHKLALAGRIKTQEQTNGNHPGEASQG